jgi:hypothetical protein
MNNVKVEIQITIILVCLFVCSHRGSISRNYDGFDTVPMAEQIVVRSIR